jgi:hypothetical protein
MAGVLFSEIEMRCAYGASLLGCVLVRESADGVAANQKYRIVDARNNAVVVPTNSVLATIKNFCKVADPSIT